MKKIFFLVSTLFLFSSVAVYPAYAEQEFSESAACTQAGGTCIPGTLFKSDNVCPEDQTKLGICKGYVNNTACCQSKVVSLNAKAIPELSVSDPVIPVVGEKNCISAGGQCKGAGIAALVSADACDNAGGSGGGTENFAGVCSLPGLTLNSSASIRRFDCCVPKNVTAVTQQSKYITSDQCQAISGKEVAVNKDIVDAIGDVIATAVTAGTSTCEADDPGSIFEGFTGTFGAEQVCCVSKASPLGQTEAAANAGIGTAAPLEYGDYQLLESIPGSSNDASDLPTYLQNIYQAGLVLIVLGAIFMIGMGGFTYIASAGNTHTMAKGKGMIKDALYGLIIALATWLILNIINPDLVNLTIQTPETLDFDPIATSIEDNTVAANNASSVPSGVKQGRAIKCPTALVSIPSDIPLKGGTNQICPGLLTELQKLKSVSGWRITRLTGGGAQSSCHKVGTDNTGSCADIAFSANPGFNSPKWDALCNAAASMKGVRVLNEASNSPACSRLFGNFIKTPNQTGAHLHIDYTGK
jgi:hypothetical protein